MKLLKIFWVLALLNVQFTYAQDTVLLSPKNLSSNLIVCH